MPISSHAKGARRERQIVELHRELGIEAKRVFLSVQERLGGDKQRCDVDVYPFGKDYAPLCCEVKGRASGNGFATLEKWLANNAALFLVRDRADPLVVLPWGVWADLLLRLRRA